MAVNIGPRIGIEGEAEYRKELMNIIQTQKTLNAEMQASQSAWDADSSAKQKATQKTQILSAQIKTQKQRVEMLKKGLEESAEKFGENDTKTLKWRQALAEATTELNRLQSEMREVPTKVQALGQKFEDVGQKMQKAGQKIQTAGNAITSIGSTLTKSVTTPVLAAGVAAIKLASDYEENLNKVDSAFKDNSGVVKDWAKTATSNFGMSESAALDATATFGDMATSMGLSNEEAAQMSISLAGLAGDLSSFKNIDIKTAMTALKGVFTGETESLKGLGVVMTETNLKAFAEDLGLVYDNMSQAEKVTLRYQYVMKNTSNAQGDYLKTSEGFANSFRTLKAEVSNLGAAFGQELLPYITPVVHKATELVRGFGDLDESTKQMIIRTAGLAAAVGPVLVAGGKVVTGFGKLVEGGGKAVETIGKMIRNHGLNAAAATGDAAATTAAATAQTALNTAMEASPIAGFALAVGSLAGMAVIAYKGYKDLERKAREANEEMYNTIDAVNGTNDALAAASEGLVNGMESAKDAISDVEATAKAATGIADDIEDLTSKTKLTTDEQNRLKVLVGEMNELFPEMSLAINETGNSLNMSTEEIRNFIDQSYKMAKARAYADALTQTFSDMANAELAVAKAQIEHDNLLEQRGQLEQQVTSEMEARKALMENMGDVERELYSLGTEVNGGYGTQRIALNDATEALEENEEAQKKCNETLKEAQKEHNLNMQALEALADELGISVDELIGFQDAAEETGEAVEEMADDTDDAAEEVQEANEKIRKSYEDAYNSAKDSILKQGDLWEEFETKPATSLAQMKMALKSHGEAMRSWNTNASTLLNSTRYATDEAFRDMVNSVIQGGLDLAPQLQVIYDMFVSGDAELEELIAGYGGDVSAGEVMAQNMAKAETVAKEGIDAYNQAVVGEIDAGQKSINQKLSNPTGVADSLKTGFLGIAKIAKKEGRSTGKSVPDSVSTGIKDGNGEIETAAGEMESETASGIGSIIKLAIDSVTAGLTVSKGLAAGLIAGKPQIETSASNITTAVRTGITNVSNLQSSAKSAGTSVAYSIKSGLENNEISGAMSTISSAVRTGIQAVESQKTSAKTAGTNIGSELAAGLDGQQSAVSSAGRRLGDSAANGVGGAQGNAQINGRKVIDAAANELKKYEGSQEPWTWGRHLGDNFANGLESSYSNVLAKARMIANAVASVLQHSTPKEGPLKNDDVWGLHLGQNFAEGMTQAIPAVESAALGIADAAAMIPTATTLDIDAMTGRNVQADALTPMNITDAFIAAAENIDWKVMIGSREFGRILREQGVYA